jgi:hypothetical protein
MLSRVSAQERSQTTADVAGAILRHAPGLAAVGVAVLYVAGALTKVSEVSGAGFSASTVLSDIPIQQLLALGISSLASPVAIEAAAVATAIAVVAGLAPEYFMHESAPEPGRVADEPETAPDAASKPQHVNSWIASPPWLIKVVVGILERGDRNLTLKSVERIATWLNMDPLELLRPR